MIDVLIRSLMDEFGYGVWIYDKDEGGRVIRVLQNVQAEWKDWEPGHRLPPPMFSTGTREGELIFEKFIERARGNGEGGAGAKGG